MTNGDMPKAVLKQVAGQVAIAVENALDYPLYSGSNHRRSSDWHSQRQECHSNF